GGFAIPDGEDTAELSAGDEAVDGRGPGARQPTRITVACRQGRVAGQTTRGADPSVLGDVCGAQALCERGAGVRRETMRIAVIGSGGVGGAFGAALAQAGADVTFLARGAHLEAMRANGLRIASPRGDMHINPCKATDNPADIGVVDVVLFCVKLWDVESAR